MIRKKAEIKRRDNSGDMKSGEQMEESFLPPLPQCIPRQKPRIISNIQLNPPGSNKISRLPEENKERYLMKKEMRMVSGKSIGPEVSDGSDSNIKEW